MDNMFKVGQSVVVKPDTKDPDMDIDIGGWQGRIAECEPDEDVICIAWDSITLKAMPAWTIDKSEEEGLNWQRMYLSQAAVEPAKPRDAPADVFAAIGIIEGQHRWDHLGEVGKRIQAVLADIHPDDDSAAVQAWEAHLRQRLRLPFKARVFECFWESGLLSEGDRVEVIGITGAYDLIGVMAEVRHRNKHFEHPLSELEAIDRKSPNYGLLRD